MLDHFHMLADYNAWANRRVYDAAAALSDEELHRDGGAFFGSVFATLCHLVIADRIWLGRLTGTGPGPGRPDEQPASTLPALRAIREVEDDKLKAYCAGLQPATLDTRLTYQPTGQLDTVTIRIVRALTHLFNHQTHHRGQVHTLLTAMDKPSLVLDLIYFLNIEARSYL